MMHVETNAEDVGREMLTSFDSEIAKQSKLEKQGPLITLGV